MRIEANKRPESKHFHELTTGNYFASVAFPDRHHQRLSSEIAQAFTDVVAAQEHVEEYSYYPHQWVSPYIDHRRKMGRKLYALLGLTPDNKAGMQAQHGRNYAFFDAPVG